MIYRKIKIYRNHRQMTSSLLSPNIYQPFPGRKSNCAPQGAISASSCFGLQPETRLTKLLKISTPKSHLITKRKSQADCWMVYEPRKHGLDENGLLKTYVLLMGWYNARNYNDNTEVCQKRGESSWCHFFLSPEHNMDSKRLFVFLLISCVLMTVCVQPAVSQGLRWGREFQEEDSPKMRPMKEFRRKYERKLGASKDGGLFHFLY